MPNKSVLKIIGPAYSNEVPFILSYTASVGIPYDATNSDLSNTNKYSSSYYLIPSDQLKTSFSSNSYLYTFCCSFYETTRLEDAEYDDVQIQPRKQQPCCTGKPEGRYHVHNCGGKCCSDDSIHQPGMGRIGTVSVRQTKDLDGQDICGYCFPNYISKCNVN
ncbi:unnamed protein product [Didymodactylos carnosus]|uniref:Uncharacterized protein n=1 Tax=Didymodactylos carnosus TaxID=1234261 RepID=A0A814SEE0_9BILA|nr:unnamed protein product [Didymodactylos carnosus]CAF1146950.1 unnamed protein product [Didymodactylos carnosus]CAF3697108.1 unnamed protein product [Didymodactylos carnosus]CAF3910505.1 unnamed protein product [Didymodactylos carnosus]